MDDTAAWKRLCNLLDDDEHLWPAVEEALEDSDGDPWDALLSGLDDAGALAYLDPEDSGMEVADALAQLPRVFRLQPDLGEANDTDDLTAAIAAADEALGAHGFRVVQLDEPDEDAHALVVVPAGSVDDILDLAQELELDISRGGATA